MSKNYLNQIKYLNSKIWEVEWSGVGFYTTKGEFGKKGFEITMEYIFPMQKGEAAYTEFITDNSVVEFLMENPQYLSMNRSLHHSHNNMNVWFSGVDMSEITENSEFYNYYLSVISNNKEEICAKIAFRGTSKEEVKKVINYKGENGEPKTFTINTKEEKDVVFLYNCEIIKDTEELVDDSYKQRVAKIIQDALLKETEKQIKYQSYQQGKQNTLFDSMTFQEKSNYNWLNPPKEESSHSDEIEGFVASLVALDHLNSDNLTETLKKVRKRFGASLNDKNETEVSLYCQTVCENFQNYYHTYYDDITEESLLDVLEETYEILEEHAVTNWLADELYSSLVVMYDEWSELKETEDAGITN